MTSQITPLYSTPDGTVFDEDDALRVYLEEVNAALKFAPDVLSINAEAHAKDLWHDAAYFSDTDRQSALRVQKEVAWWALLLGRKYACEAKLKMKLKSCDYTTTLKMNRCVEQANMEILMHTSMSPERLCDTGFYIKTKDDKVHRVQVGTLYVATQYCPGGKRELQFQVKPAEYRLPFWINIPEAAELFKQFTCNLDRPALERVAKTYVDSKGVEKTTTYWGLFGGSYHYTKHLLECATDEKGKLIPFELFCDRWIHVEGKRKEIHLANPPCFTPDQGSGCSDDPYIASWDHISTEQNRFVEDTPQEQAVKELKALDVWPELTFSREFHSAAEEAIQALELLDDANVPEPISIYP